MNFLALFRFQFTSIRGLTSNADKPNNGEETIRGRDKIVTESGFTLDISVTLIF